MTTICVCGAGTMGSGIAQVAAQAGYKTIQFDVNEAMLQKSKASIEKFLQASVEKNKITEDDKTNTLKNLVFTSNINDCIADIVIEAIIEKKEAKVSLFNQLAAINSAKTILATNTSSIAVNEIAKEIEIYFQLLILQSLVMVSTLYISKHYILYYYHLLMIFQILCFLIVIF